ncbi:glycoside hydrolase family 92 protein [Auriscalpium vulgare]|uniref:Glycoside hydrolase family 92 protein n=1 Tax=Auriscalpium vulgare TaxID=40419 RepID=A0ACB8R1I6_9AGAM|nr:glycoside hydrolase family 92 protein [Auriscalpium vulgare]
MHAGPPHGHPSSLLRASLIAMLLVLMWLGLSQDDACVVAQPDPAQYVNMFIGTTNDGHVFPGATRPHGMVKVGMDTDSPGNHAGYDADPVYRVMGFSQLHDDGTGGGVPLSNFKILPSNCSSFTECPTSLYARKVLRALLPNGSPDDAASPGYFASNLSTGIRVEMTATRRTSLQRHTFPAPAGPSSPPSASPSSPYSHDIPHGIVNVDISNDGQISSQSPSVYINPHTGRVTGGSSFQASFGPGRYKVYACVDFHVPGARGAVPVAPSQYGAWSDTGVVENTTVGTQVTQGNAYASLGALLSFPLDPRTRTLLVRTGVSFISTEQACSNAEEEIPTFDFEGVQRAARAEWNEVLGTVDMEMAEGLEDTRVLMYSSLYRSHISPADYSGENPSWSSPEPYYDSFYCNWDTYRTLYPLYSLHDPERYAHIVRGMINIQQHEGWLPECRGATQMQFIQGGSSGDPILAEFYVKFAKFSEGLNVSALALYNALLADAEATPSNWDLQGREADAWKKYNFIPWDLWELGGSNGARTVSRALEYAYGDFTIAQVAQLLNKSDDAAKYAQRAENFLTLWDPTVDMPDGPGSVKGMFQPRLLDGTYRYVDPRHCSPNDPTHSTCYLDPNALDGFYEELHRSSRFHH